jgi:hypothetical protein
MLTKKNGWCRISCGVNLRSNERTIEIEVGGDIGSRPFIIVKMTPKDFSEALVSHVDRQCQVEDLRD